MQGLTYGFWPFASLPSAEIVDHPNHRVCDDHPDALTESRDEELAGKRYSPPFFHLLPGMKVSPLLIVEKTGSSKLRVCTDMSFGHPSLNDLIDKEKARVAYDSLISFGPYMTEITPRGGYLILWKSDVARAYRNLPMAPQWQVRQIVKIDNRYYADRCSNFGSAASPKIWCSVFSLVLWIAVHKLGVKRINNLMDDTWGVAHSDSITSFKGMDIPLDQALLLLLFDTINMPWEWKKQLAGPQLEIIGHFVNASDLSFTLTQEKKAALVEALRSFTRSPSHRLKDWQRLLGWASWGLNTFPYGRHALQSSWDKLVNKTSRFAPIHVNREVQDDLRWLASSIEASPGQYFLQASTWGTNKADMILVTDACPTGLGIWAPNTQEGFHHIMPPPSRDIYWMELRAVVLALALALSRGAKRVFICTDSMNVCDLFQAHSPIPLVRPLFRAAAHMLVDQAADVKVAHIPGSRNVYADALSRNKLSTVLALAPDARLQPIPHHDALPDGGHRR